MRIVVSPYHLTTREAPAMAALLLAEEAVTLMPVPFQGTHTEAIARACDDVPRYIEFMESWRWSMPLWEAGVLGSVLDGEDAIEDVRDVLSLLTSEARYKGLAGLVDQGVFDEERSYLAAVTLDILRGGPDPGISIPITAGLDRFATRHWLAVARAAPSSIVQQTEARLARTIGRVALPVLIQAEGQTILDARTLLAEPLADLRTALDATVNETNDGLPLLKDSALAYAEAFEHVLDHLTPEEDELQLRTATVALTIVSLPVHASLDSSLSALTAVGARPRHNHRPTGPEPETFTSIFMKQIGKAAGATRRSPPRGYS